MLRARSVGTRSVTAPAATSTRSSDRPTQGRKSPTISRPPAVSTACRKSSVAAVLQPLPQGTSTARRSSLRDQGAREIRGGCAGPRRAHRLPRVVGAGRLHRTVLRGRRPLRTTLITSWSGAVRIQATQELGQIRIGSNATMASSPVRSSTRSSARSSSTGSSRWASSMTRTSSESTPRTGLRR